MKNGPENVSSGPLMLRRAQWRYGAALSAFGFTRVR
jgi:alkyl sulfatase BDS1-like metallo-beta-lactamase superfamily hydrolase